VVEMLYLSRLVREAMRKFAAETPCIIDTTEAINGERVNIDLVLGKYW